MDRDRVWHYIKPNETTRIPRRHVFVDVEAHEDPLHGGREQRWALAVACFHEIRPGKSPVERWQTFDDQLLLWQAVVGHCQQGRRTVMWCHNLGYDSRIGEVFDTLPSLGWQLIGHSLVGRAPWMVWRKGKATLTMVDSQGVFNVTLERLGVAIGLPKLPLPEFGSAGIGLYSRCWRDVEILRQATLEYLQWIETEDLGNWQLTGAGQSWAAFRHRFMHDRLLVHDDREALAAERRALWTGRCEAYWRGEIGYQVIHEWDLPMAYAKIAQTTAVPVRLVGPMPPDYDWGSLLGSATVAFLAEVDVSTSVPVVPAMADGRILWPVGTFTTTLWDVEIQAALDAGATVTVRQGWLYHKAPALARWADWVTGQIAELERGDMGWRHIVLKHWSRALIGRFAMTYTQWEEYATGPDNRVHGGPVYDADTGETFTILQIGRTQWRQTGVAEWGQSIPAITGYVQAVCRVRMWTILREVPTDAALYVDTDGILATDRHLEAVQAVSDAHPEWGLRLKRSWQGFAVWGPRQIRTGPKVRVAGVAKTATAVGRGVFTGQVWETLPTALQRGNAGRVSIRDRTWHVRGVDRRRRGPGVGWTEPIELRGGDEHDRRDERDSGRSGTEPHRGGVDRTAGNAERVHPAARGRRRAGRGDRASRGDRGRQRDDGHQRVTSG